jgi:hypothetical protein
MSPRPTNISPAFQHGIILKITVLGDCSCGCQVEPDISWNVEPPTPEMLKLGSQLTFSGLADLIGKMRKNLAEALGIPQHLLTDKREDPPYHDSYQGLEERDDPDPANWWREV